MVVRLRIDMAILAAWLVAQTACALTWTRENSVTPGTVALYHFNELSGVTVSNAAGAARVLVLEDARMRFNESNTWHAGLVRGIATTGLTVSTLRFDFTTDWHATDLTISFWLRVPAPLVSNTHAPVLPDTPWGARCSAAWLPDQSAPLCLRVRNVPVTLASISSTTLCDGAWHHLAWAYHAASQSAASFFDNMPQTNVFLATGEMAPVLDTLVIGDGFAGPALGSVHLDELLITTLYLTDFSDGFVPEPARAVFACIIFPAVCRMAARVHHTL